MPRPELAEALEHWTDYRIKRDMRPVLDPFEYDNLALIVEAARGVLEGEPVWWCDFHKAAGEPNTDCWGAGLNGQDSCEMVQRTLINQGDAE